MAAPADIQALFEDQNGRELLHIANKRFTRTDLDRRQSRVRLPGLSESTIQLGMLSLSQQAAANFLPQAEMNRMVETGFLTMEDMRGAMALKGVTVLVFVISPGEIRSNGQGTLKKWNCGSIVIHGKNAFQAWRHLQEGDLVELWGFKNEENKLFFVIRRVVDDV